MTTNLSYSSVHYGVGWLDQSPNHPRFYQNMHIVHVAKYVMVRPMYDAKQDRLSLKELLTQRETWWTPLDS